MDRAMRKKLTEKINLKAIHSIYDLAMQLRILGFAPIGGKNGRPAHHLSHEICHFIPP
jgi:hypothetical protein